MKWLWPHTFWAPLSSHLQNYFCKSDKGECGDSKLKLGELAEQKQTIAVTFSSPLALLPTLTLSSPLPSASQMLVLLWWFNLESHLNFSPHQGLPCYSHVPYSRASKQVQNLRIFQILPRCIHWASMAKSCPDIGTTWFLSKWEWTKNKKFKVMHITRLSRLLLKLGCHWCCGRPPQDFLTPRPVYM